MEIILEKTGKKFNSEWIFRNFSHTFEKNNTYAILGRNGSGKSTLLQVIAGNILPTSGTVKYYHDAKEISEQKIFRHVSVSAPYQELIEEFTLREMLTFHFHFKSILPGYSMKKALDILNLENSENKIIRLYSSGMKQRVKLILAFLSDTPVLLLDEPTTNLDQAGMDWYLNLIREFSRNRTVIICSNLQQQETGFCSGKIFIEDFK